MEESVSLTLRTKPNNKQTIMENSILGNQLVVMSRADLDALLERMASNLAASKVEECVSNDVRPGVCDEERFLTREEAAKMLHVDYSTLWRWNKLSILCPNKVGPRRVMYKYSDVLKKLNGEGQQEGRQKGEQKEEQKEEQKGEGNEDRG